MKQRYLHIGYPKCASSSLQYDYFTAHPETYHLGWGCPHTRSGWVSDDVAAVMEADVRFGKVTQYRPETTLGALKNHFEIAESDKRYKAIGISWESLCFTLLYDVDVTIKAKRMHEALGDGTKIIVVIRNQLNLIRSMYLEMVRGGASLSFEAYLEYLYHYRFTGLTTDLFYHEILTVYGDLFGYENLMILLFEHIERKPSFELYRISDFLGLANAIEEMGRHNTSHDLRQLERVREINARKPHNFGSPLFTPVDPEKLVAYWRRDGLDTPPTSLYALMARSRHLEEAMGGFDDKQVPIDAEYPPYWRERFSKLYAPSNDITAKQWNLDLAAYGYPLVSI